MSEKPKIIVDEDWKSQVQAEKAVVEKKGPESQPASPAPVTTIPPPSLPLLFSTLATQAMVALGELADPVTNKAEVHLEEAKHFIDTLQLLEEKTKGNRTPDETAMLSSLLHQLRLGYVMSQAKPRSNPPQQP